MQRPLRASALFTGYSLFALSATVPVTTMAQDAQTTAETQQQAPAAPAADDAIAEVVVTAQKREEKLQEVPLAVSVVGAAQLQQQNIQNVQDLVRATPSLEVFGQPGNPDTRIGIRGISTNSFSITSEQAVSIVADGVVLGRAPLVSLFDIGQIEVLRGPQGTLFGKNASAGVVSITTNKPDPSKFEVIGHADLSGKYDYRLLQGTVNLPISDEAAVRISAGQSYTSGFLHNAVRDEDSIADVKGARARLLWEPRSGLSFNLIADYEKQKTSEQLYLQFARYDNPATPGVDPIPGCGGALASPSNRTACGGDPSQYAGESWGFSAQGDLDLGPVALTSITSVRRYLQDGNLDVDGLPGAYYANGNVFDNKVFSQELRLASNSGERLEYVAGLYYSKADVYNYLTQNFGALLFGFPIGNPNEYDAELESIAAFGQVSYRVSEPLRLTAGARVTRDEVSMVSQSFLETPPYIPPPLNSGPLGDPLRGSDTVNNFSWRLAADYKLNETTMAYASVSKGYKGPQVVFNPPSFLPVLFGGGITPASVDIVDPEYPTDYEAGIKSTLLDGRMIANLNFFHTTIRDFQSSSLNAQGGSTPGNISKIVTKGVELDLFGRPLRGLTLSGGAIYNKATYPDYIVSCTSYAPRCVNGFENVEGQQLVAAPKWKITLASEYERALPFFGLSGFVGGDMVYRANIRYLENSDPRTQTGVNAIFGARLGVRSLDQGWTLALFARNLFDERYPQYLYAPYLFSQQSSPGYDTAGQALSTESFRFIGMSLDVRF